LKPNVESRHAIHTTGVKPRSRRSCPEDEIFASLRFDDVAFAIAPAIATAVVFFKTVLETLAPVDVVEKTTANAALATLAEGLAWQPALMRDSA